MNPRDLVQSSEYLPAAVLTPQQVGLWLSISPRTALRLPLGWFPVGAGGTGGDSKKKRQVKRCLARDVIGWIEGQREKAA